jgi:hypothetical protein
VLVYGSTFVVLSPTILMLESGMPPFEPYHLQPLATLNQRRIIALPGVEPELVGQTGYTAASQPALMALLRAQARELGLEAEPEANYPQRLNDLLESPEASLRIASEGVAQTHGRRLGALLASILLSPSGLTDPLDPWEADYLSYWRVQVGTLILGGGLGNGLLGQVICRAVTEVFENCGLSAIQVQAAENPSFLPLLGAARSLVLRSGGLAPVIAAVADFGGTQAKRGLAVYGLDGSLLRLEVYPSRHVAALIAPGKTAELAACMVETLAETIRKFPEGYLLIPKVLVCLAAYVQNGKPLNLERGGYYALNQLSSDISAWFSEQVSQASGRAVEVEFLHDCDAAAAALAGRERAAVVMLGSALGVGFVPPEEGYRKVAPDFEVVVRL